MIARDVQSAFAERLRQLFGDDAVEYEWRISRGASDALAHDPFRYSPRVDLAVGPFNTGPDRRSDLQPSLLPRAFRAAIGDRRTNQNPRCLLAIELAFSGTSKHMIGDLLHASAMGLYGIVVGSDRSMAKLRRINEYLLAIEALGKTPHLFRNVLIMAVEEFETLLAGATMDPTKLTIPARDSTRRRS